jgi:mono/diheme cytochrome c family protein
MISRAFVVQAAAVLLFAAALGGRLSLAAVQADAAQANPDTWQIPPNAAQEVNPLPLNDKVLAQGKKIFESRCARCHGPGGKGNGPDADPDHKPEDLTDSRRASRNPDGVMFYKIWNGRKNPRMPAFKTDLAKNEIWTVIHYVKTLRQ